MAQGLSGQDAKLSWEALAFFASLPASPNTFTAQSGSGRLVTGRYVVTGYSGINAATTAGTIALYDGQDATGEFISAAVVPASSAFNVALPNQGVQTDIGLFIVVTTATVTGSVLMVPLWTYNVTPPGT